MSWKGCNGCDDVSGDEHGMSKEGCAGISWELVEREKSRTWEESECKNKLNLFIFRSLKRFKLKGW